MSIFKKIGLFFVGLFNAAKKAYEDLNPEQKDALKNGSGIIEIINDNLEKTPAAIRALIKDRYPNLDEAKVEAGFVAICHYFNISFNGLDDAILGVMAHLNKLDGKAWAVASHSAASLLSVIFAPNETKVATIVSLIEFVYQKFFKKAVPDKEEETED